MSTVQSSAQKWHAFVAMCFDNRLDHIYLKVVKPILSAHSFFCCRADEIKDEGHIVNQIKDAIQKSDLIVCDLTFNNPNVFYELGFAHSLGKSTIMLSQKPADIPFDIRCMRVIQYEDTNTGLLDLRDNFEKHVESAEKSLGKESQYSAPVLEFSVTHDDLSFQRQCLFSVSVDTRRYAIKFLGDCSDKDSYKTIERISGIESNSDIVRDAYTALYKIDSLQAHKTLIEEGLRTQKDYLVRERVVSLLGNYDPDEKLLKQMHDQATDSSWGVRRNVCMVLGKWAKKESLSKLEMMLGDPELQVRLLASEAIATVQQRQAVPQQVAKT